MRRTAIVLVATAAALVGGLASAGAAAADPLGPVRERVTVFVTGDGDVCATYQGTTTVCTTT